MLGCRSHRRSRRRTANELWCTLIPTRYARFCTFRNHGNQEWNVTKRYANIDSETFAVGGAIFPVDFPAETVGTLQCICERDSCVSKTDVRGTWVRILSSASAPHWEHNKISTLTPKRRTVNVLYSREKYTASRVWLLTQELCVIYCTNFHSHRHPSPTLLSSHTHTGRSTQNWNFNFSCTTRSITLLSVFSGTGLTKNLTRNWVRNPKRNPERNPE